MSLDCQTLLQHSNDAFLHKDYEEALDYFKQVIQIDSKHYHAYLNAGNALCYLGRYKTALKYYNQAIALDSTNTSAIYNRALAYKRLGHLLAAIADYTLAIKLDKKTLRVISIVARCSCNKRSGKMPKPISATRLLLIG